jgi:type II secretory pathway pseudopilin PulG
MKRPQSNEAGFTLLELLVLIASLVILSVIVVSILELR